MTLNTLIKTILAIFLAFFSQLIYADWVEVSSSDEYTAYVEIKSLSKLKDIVSMSSLYDFQKPQELNKSSFLSLKHIREYDCNQNRQRVIYSEFYNLNMGKGDLLGKTSKLYSWRDNGPNTIDEHLWQVACAYKK